MKKLFYVGVYLKDRIHFGLYGFTNYADCYTEANTPEEAQSNARNYFETKFKVEVLSTRTTIANKRYCNPEQIIKPFQKGIQTQLIHLSNTSNEQATIFQSVGRKPKCKNIMANFRARSTVFINRIFNKWKSFNSARI